jgi:AcrR family transcriptional regulator
MPRPERERLILDVAGPVFARRGFHAASMDEIAAEAGVSKPMLYAYFGSKQGLYLAYIDRTGRELVDRLQRAAEDSRGQPRHARLQAPVREFLAFVEDYRDGWTVLFRETTTIAPVAEEVATLRTQVVGVVRAMLETGGTRTTGLPADAIAHAIVGAGESIANWWLDHPESGRDEVADWYVALVQAATTGARGRSAATPTATQPGARPAAPRA